MGNYRLRLPGFQTLNQSSLITTLKVATIIIAIVTFFFNDLTIIFSEALQNEVTSYILAIPPIFVYMIYRKRKMLRATIPSEENDQLKKLRYPSLIVGILLCITSIFLYWRGSYTFTPLEYHLLSLPIFTAGLVILMFNRQTLLQIAFPIVFLFFLTPPPSEILYTVGAWLSNLSSEMSNGLAQIIGIQSKLGSQYGTPLIILTRPDGSQLNFVVDIACSGIFSLIGFLTFAFLLIYLIRDKLWKKIALIPTGILLIYLLNVIRITTILGIGNYFGETMALQVFHLLSSWFLTFLGTLLLLVASERVFKAKIFDHKKEKCLECTTKDKSNPKFCFECGRILKPRHVSIRRADLFKIPIVLTIVVILLSFQAPVFAMTKTPANIVTNTPTGQTYSTDIFPSPPNYLLTFEFEDTNFEKTAKQDMALAYLYNPEKANLNHIWATLEIASSRYSLHRWDTCLVNFPLSQGQSAAVTQIESTDINLYDNPPIIGRYFVYQSPSTNETQAVLYWYSTATFNINNTVQQKNVMISLIAYPLTAEELESLKQQQLLIANAIVNSWEPTKLWSAMAITISVNGGYLAAATSLLLLVSTVYMAIVISRQKHANRNAYKKLSAENQEIIDSIRTAGKKNLGTLNAIANEWQKRKSKTTDKEYLLQRLLKLEKEGIIESNIVNRKDEPIQIWKT